MKRIILFITLFFAMMPITYGYSSGFDYMIEAMGIEKTNVNGFEINEYIYERYKLIVYGDPVTINYPKQRWKIVNNGNWNSNGEVGEYWVLGQDYVGNLVHNELFPDDYNSGTSPLEWNYRIVKDAEESWNDTSLYIYESQREYMLTQKLSRFGVTYDLTALDIGLDKAKVENYATWGSAGSIYTEKPGEGNVYWAATFNVPPMASNAKLASLLILPNGNEYRISKDEESIEIPYIYGAEISGLSEYAKSEHIKILESEFKIDSVRSEIKSASETTKISQNGILIINKNDYGGMNKIVLNLETNSFASTYFPNDPVMYDSNRQVVTIFFESEEVVKDKIINEAGSPAIYDIKISRVTTDSSGRKKNVDLYWNKRTRNEFVCAGQIIKIDIETSRDADEVYLYLNGFKSIVTLDDTTKKFLWDEPKSRKEDLMFSSYYDLKNTFNFPKNPTMIKETKFTKTYSLIYVIPYETTQTLHSWDSLRKESKDAFKIDESKLFTRKENSYRLMVQAVNEKGTRTKVKSFDVAERWDTLFNRDISKYIK